MAFSVGGRKNRSDKIGLLLVLLCHPKVDLQQLPEKSSGDGDESFPSRGGAGGAGGSLVLSLGSSILGACASLLGHFPCGDSCSPLGTQGLQANMVFVVL